jgi:hypothetical protein
VNLPEPGRPRPPQRPAEGLDLARLFERPEGLIEAIVAAEVLAAPLALRPPSSTRDPRGL